MAVVVGCRVFHVGVRGASSPGRDDDGQIISGSQGLRFLLVGCGGHWVYGLL